MKPNTKIRSFQRLGISAVAAGAIFFTGTEAQAADGEQELGEKLLYKGKSHEHVVELKELLEENELLEKPEGNDEWSSEFDANTEEAIKDYQEEYDLLVDGLAGVQTVGALLGLERGDENDLVLALQEDLAELGYYNSDQDGKFGPLTEEALIHFQQEEDVEDEEGIAGPHTYATLHDVTSRYNHNQDTNQSETVDTSPYSPDVSVEDEDNNEETPSNTETEGTLTMEATAYTAYCDGCSGITATGIDLRNNPDEKVIAVDPSVIPLGSIVEVEGYGRAIAGDVGGAITGQRIDLHVPSQEEAIAFGRQNVQVTIIETP
ncbi:peptidoglycan-binding protein [Salipaludibacillus sp. LMS25]|jgi:3D (Asp-Asp-Asp) domain-containing protein|uniref:peptidoglycan-binding protein n=1 Tax=Salipaludibacillus sp. LMS25 TaxID=2924031 RepID=UPI0020D0454C|nr:peptidoglycan-binding protein [Salipaludibacillus sp. LMS25]UTR14173.1 peptidoglycan-binding protein [Salipaludibacillus sp. LMS25]